MRLLKLVRKDTANDIERTSFFHTKGLETISERASNRTIVNEFEAMTSLVQVRFLSELSNKRKLFAAFQKVNR